MKIKVNNDENLRLDVYLASNTDFSRSKINNLIDSGNVLVNGLVVKKSYKVKNEDVISINDIDDEIVIEKEDIPVDIVYEDEYLAIINKKSGIVTHPAVGNKNHTLVNALLYHFNNISKKDNIRPGIVHRLDKDTSGLMVVAKDDKTHELLSEMIKSKEVERIYLALVWGNVRCDNGKIDAPIGRSITNRQKYTVTDINSKDSVTHFSVVQRFKDVTLIKCRLETGRTHQIRVHLNYIGYPIVNDLVYGNRKIIDKDYGQMLVSKSIRFIHPITGKELFFEIEPDDTFIRILDSFR